MIVMTPAPITVAAKLMVSARQPLTKVRRADATASEASTAAKAQPSPDTARAPGGRAVLAVEDEHPGQRTVRSGSRTRPRCRPAPTTARAGRGWVRDGDGARGSPRRARSSGGAAPARSGSPAGPPRPSAGSSQRGRPGLAAPGLVPIHEVPGRSLSAGAAAVPGRAGRGVGAGARPGGGVRGAPPGHLPDGCSPRRSGDCASSAGSADHGRPGWPDLHSPGSIRVTGRLRGSCAIRRTGIFAGWADHRGTPRRDTQADFLHPQPAYDVQAGQRRCRGRSTAKVTGYPHGGPPAPDGRPQGCPEACTQP